MLHATVGTFGSVMYTASPFDLVLKYIVSMLINPASQTQRYDIFEADHR